MGVLKINELTIIEKILCFEEQSLQRYKTILSEYKDDSDSLNMLGIEIVVYIRQYRGSFGRRIIPFDLREKGKLTKKYISMLHCEAHINGKRIIKKDGLPSGLLLGKFLYIVRSNRQDVEYIEHSADDIDLQIKSILAGAHRYSSID